MVAHKRALDVMNASRREGLERIGRYFPRYPSPITYVLALPLGKCTVSRQMQAVDALLLRIPRGGSQMKGSRKEVRAEVRRCEKGGA